MSKFAAFRQMRSMFQKGKKQVCGSRKPAANSPQTRTQIRRKPGRKPALNRKAVEPRNCARTTRAMDKKNRPAKSFLLPFSKFME
jgi:hypothetical protein